MLRRTSPGCGKSRNSNSPASHFTALQSRAGMKNAPLAAETRLIRLPALFSLVLVCNSGHEGARVLHTFYAVQGSVQSLEIRPQATYGLFAFVLRLYAGCISDRSGVCKPGSFVGVGVVFSLNSRG